ncbi:MAG: PEP-CTERM sorting domain-containing protein [Armatimonadota bacterium]|nr:PEP-CTERM sorting domain-containing protein [Armatimonadota bacterium]
MNKVILASGLAAMAAGAQAMLIIDPTPGNLPGTENVLFNEGGLIATGPLVQGVISNSDTTVDFFGAGEDLETPPGGQARVTALDGALMALTTKMTDPTLGIAAYQLNINAKVNCDVTIDLYELGVITHTETFTVDSGGSNWFKIYGDAGEVMSQVSFTATGEVLDFRQNRIGAAPAPVPEPSALLGLGVGLAMLLRRRVKK